MNPSPQGTVPVTCFLCITVSVTRTSSPNLNFTKLYTSSQHRKSDLWGGRFAEPQASTRTSNHKPPVKVRTAYRELQVVAAWPIILYDGFSTSESTVGFGNILLVKTQWHPVAASFGSA